MMNHQYFLLIINFCVLFYFPRKINAIFSIHEFCKFDEELKDLIRNLECEGDIDECATAIRYLVQNYYPGSWGVVIVADKKDVMDEKIEWYLNPMNPRPSLCRMIVDDNTVVEIFRTGYRTKDIKDNQQHRIWSEAKNANLNENYLNLCPHSILRQIISIFSVKAHSEMFQRRYRHGLKSKLHSAAKSLAHVFNAETSHNWNVIITKNDNDFSPLNIGYNIPHYVYDSQSGFCIGQTRDGYTINAAITGFTDKQEEIMSEG